VSSSRYNAVNNKGPVPDLVPSTKFRDGEYNYIKSEPWYFGNIKRFEAEEHLLLKENYSGAFLIRDSDSTSNEYS